MFKILQGADILKSIYLHSKDAQHIRIAAPFWGKGAASRLGLPRKVGALKLRLICNLESGACNPAPIKQLQKEFGWQTRTNQQLHAKLYIIDGMAILGSANPSANGLALEGLELEGWRELCVEISNRSEVTKLINWFEELWTHSTTKEIESADYRKAEKDWKKRRRGRPMISGGGKRPRLSFLDYTRRYSEVIRDRDIVVAIYGQKAEPWANKLFRTVKKEFKLSADYDFYYSWPDAKVGKTVLDYSYTSNKDAEPDFGGIFEVTQVVRDSSNRKRTITIVKRQNNILALRLSNQDRVAMKRMVSKVLASDPAGVRGGTLREEWEITEFLRHNEGSYKVAVKGVAG